MLGALRRNAYSIQENVFAPEAQRTLAGGEAEPQSAGQWLNQPAARRQRD